jgi:anti-sigma B factor antagonist
MDKPRQHFTITRERRRDDSSERVRIRLVLAGEFDLAARDALDGALASALRAGDVEVDMAGVSFLDCSGIGVLTRGLRQAWREGRGLQVVNAGGPVRHMLELTGVAQELVVLSSAHRPATALQRRAKANGRVH